MPLPNTDINKFTKPYWISTERAYLCLSKERLEKFLYGQIIDNTRYDFYLISMPSGIKIRIRYRDQFIGSEYTWGLTVSRFKARFNFYKNTLGISLFDEVSILIEELEFSEA